MHFQKNQSKWVSSILAHFEKKRGWFNGNILTFRYYKCTCKTLKQIKVRRFGLRFVL